VSFFESNALKIITLTQSFLLACHRKHVKSWPCSKSLFEVAKFAIAAAKLENGHKSFCKKSL